MADLAPLRIGITGSRFYSSPAAIRAAFIAAHDRARPHDGHILVHGQCDPRHPDTRRRIPWETAKRVSWEVQRRYLGADWLAEQVALDMGRAAGWEYERHPADWTAPCRGECKPGHRKPWGCPAAGNYRNQDGIIGSGLDVLLSFFQAGEANSGTSDCARRAVAARVPVMPFGEVPPAIASMMAVLQ